MARELGAMDTEAATLRRAVELAAASIGACDHAGITLVHRRGARLETVAATSDVPSRGDRLQYDLGEGPALDAIRDLDSTLSSDVRSDQRWPRWGARAAEELGVASMMCFRLFASHQSYGGLSLYAARVDAFHEDDEALGLALAAQTAAALTARREIETRDVAINRRTTIGQAQGILMERHGITADEAIGILKQVSQDTNRKLFDLAEELIRTRRDPDH
jgi:GAF domain-containing protein